MAAKKRKSRRPQPSPDEEAAETLVKRNKSLEEPAEPDHKDKLEQEKEDPQKYASEEESDDEEDAEEEEEEEEEEEAEEEEEEEEEEAEEESDDEEDTEEEEEKENEPVPKPTETKPAESADEEDEGENGEEKEVVFKQVNKREYESAKKKQKIAASPSQSSKFTRIWSYDDEFKLMQALFQFHREQGRPPNQKEYGLFHKSLKDLNPAIQDKQVRNKIRTFKDAHSAWKRRGTPPFTPSNPNAKALFEISKKLWGENVKVPMKVEEVVDDISDDEEVVEVKNINGTNTINGEQNVKNKLKFPYVANAIKELARKYGNLLFWENSFKMMETSKAGKFEAMFKKQKYNEAKFILKELKLTTELAKELTSHAK